MTAHDDEKPLTFYEASAKMTMHVYELAAAICHNLRAHGLADRMTQRAIEQDIIRREHRDAVTGDSS